MINESTQERLAGLQGLITHEQGMTLARYASQVDPSLAIVNLGVYKAKSACYLAAGAGRDGAHVYGIDAWDHPDNVPGRFRYDEAYDDAVAQVKAMRYSKRITLLQGLSHLVGHAWPDFSEKGVGLLFVDADHHYASVKADLWAWGHNMSDQGVIICDDYDTPRNPGVKQAVQEYALATGRSVSVEAERLAILQ